MNRRAAWLLLVLAGVLVGFSVVLPAGVEPRMRNLLVAGALAALAAGITLLVRARRPEARDDRLHDHGVEDP